MILGDCGSKRKQTKTFADTYSI